MLPIRTICALFLALATSLLAKEQEFRFEKPDAQTGEVMAEFNQWSFVFARYVSRLTPGAHDPYSPHTTEALNWFIAEPSKDSILTSSSRKSRSTALGVIEVLKCNVAL